MRQCECRAAAIWRRWFHTKGVMAHSTTSQRNQESVTGGTATPTRRPSTGFVPHKAAAAIRAAYGANGTVAS